MELSDFSMLPGWAVEELEGVLRAPRPLPDVRYQGDPLGWMVEVLGDRRESVDWGMRYSGHEWDGTVNPLVAILEGLVAGRSVGVESATTTGKTWLAARVVGWWLACWPEALVVTVAPKEDQLKLHIWKEIARYWPKFQAAYPSAERSDLRIRMRGDDAWAAHGFVCGVRAEEVEGSATRAQGFHAEHMLIIHEEMPGNAPAVVTAFRNTCRAPHNLRLGMGQPDNQHDELHRFCQSSRVVAVRVSAYDHPNVVLNDPGCIPGAVSRQGIEDAKVDDGEGSDMFQSRVRGVSPAQSVYALIRQEWLDQAATRFAMAVEVGVVAGAIGVDCAQSESGDRSAVARFVGDRLVELVVKPCPNATHLAVEVWQMAQEHGVESGHIGVDPIGVGAATLNELNRLAGDGLVQALVGGAKALTSASRAPDGSVMDWVSDANRFKNLRGQMVWQLREDLRQGRLALPKRESLHRELTTPTYAIVGGVVVVQSKDDCVWPNGKSPDEMDAVVYANWVRPRTREARRTAYDQDNRHPGFTRDGRVADVRGPDPERAPKVPVVYRMPWSESHDERW